VLEDAAASGAEVLVVCRQGNDSQLASNQLFFNAQFRSF
jgi:rhodanese-related sulfurtransferase